MGSTNVEQLVHVPVHLMSDLKRCNARLQAAAKVALAANTILDPHMLVDQIVDLVCEQFGFYYVGLYLMDQTGHWAVLRAGAGAGTGRQMLEQGHRVDIGGSSTIGQALAGRQASIALDLGLDDPFLPEARSGMALPLVSRGQVMGAMTLQSEREAAFSSEDLAVFQTMADQLAVAIENARLFEDARREARQVNERVRALDCLNDVGRRIDERPDISDLLPWIAERIPAAMRHAERDVCQVAIEYEEQVYGLPNAVDLPCRLVWGLRIGGELVGRMYIAYTEEHEFLDEDSALLGHIARRVGGYIESRRLLEETRLNAEESAVLYELGQTLSARLDMDQVLEGIYWGASRLLDTTNFYIGLYDSEKHQVNFPFDVTESVIDRRISIISADEGLTGYVVRNGATVLIGEDVAGWMRAHGIETVGEPAQCWLGVPLLVGDSVQGVMAVQNYVMPHAYGEADRDRLVAIASHASIAIQNARLFEQIQMRARYEQTLREITARVHSSTDPDAIMRTAVRELGAALGRRAFTRLGTAEELLRPEYPDGAGLEGGE